MSNQDEKIRNPKPPTKTDLKILAYMDSGNFIDDEKGRTIFKCFGLRDAIYRLRKAGYEIKDKWVTSQFSGKSYKNWYTKDEVVIKAGYTTEKALKADGKDLVAISRKIQDIGKVSQLRLL